MSWGVMKLAGAKENNGPLVLKIRHRFKSYLYINAFPNLTQWWHKVTQCANMKLGEKNDMTVLNQCAKF